MIHFNCYRSVKMKESSRWKSISQCKLLQAKPHTDTPPLLCWQQQLVILEIRLHLSSPGSAPSVWASDGNSCKNRAKNCLLLLHLRTPTTQWEFQEEGLEKTGDKKKRHLGCRLIQNWGLLWEVTRDFFTDDGGMGISPDSSYCYFHPLSFSLFRFPLWWWSTKKKKDYCHHTIYCYDYHHHQYELCYSSSQRTFVYRDRESRFSL
jgi:hypothetical protein